MTLEPTDAVDGDGNRRDQSGTLALVGGGQLGSDLVAGVADVPGGLGQGLGPLTLAELAQVTLVGRHCGRNDPGLFRLNGAQRAGHVQVPQVVVVSDVGVHFQATNPVQGGLGLGGVALLDGALCGQGLGCLFLLGTDRVQPQQHLVGSRLPTVDPGGPTTDPAAVANMGCDRRQERQDAGGHGDRAVAVTLFTIGQGHGKVSLVAGETGSVGAVLAAQEVGEAVAPDLGEPAVLGVAHQERLVSAAVGVAVVAHRATVTVLGGDGGILDGRVDPQDVAVVPVLALESLQGGDEVPAVHAHGGGVHRQHGQPLGPETLDARLVNVLALSLGDADLGPGRRGHAQLVGLVGQPLELLDQPVQVARGDGVAAAQAVAVLGVGVGHGGDGEVDVRVGLAVLVAEVVRVDPAGGGVGGGLLQAGEGRQGGAPIRHLEGPAHVGVAAGDEGVSGFQHWFVQWCEVLWRCGVQARAPSITAKSRVPSVV